MAGAARAQSLPFSGNPQSPANTPPGGYGNDQPAPPQRRAYDPRYHGHTYQSFSAPLAFEGWDLSRVRNALALHNQGNFVESSSLALKVLCFPPVMAALGQRMAPALALPRHIRAGDRGLSRVLGLAVEAQLTPRDGLYPSNVFPATLYGSTQFDLAMLGFSVWQHAFGEPDQYTGIRPLYTRRWPTWAVQYYRYRRTYVALTTDGPVDVLNDGKFTLVADNEEPHFFGAILALAEEALDGLSTRRARASWIDKYGSPKLIAIMPQGTAPNTPEGDAMLEALATIRAPEGFGALPHGTEFDAVSIQAGQSTVLNDALASNWQNVAATLLGSDGTMTRGTGVYSAPIFAGVRRDLVDRDLKCITRGVNQGHIGTWLAYNYAQTIAVNRGEWIQPVLDIPLPDPDADARIKSYADRVKSFHEIIEKERAAGFDVTQDRANQIAKSLEIDAPTLMTDDQRIARLISPAGVEKVIMAKEVRAANRLAPMGDDRDDKTIAELDAAAKVSARPGTTPGANESTATEETNQTGDTTGGETKTGSSRSGTQMSIGEMTPAIRASGDFDESKHPRAPDGKFGSGGSGSGDESGSGKDQAEKKTIEEVHERISKLPDTKSDLESDYITDETWDELDAQKERFAENLSGKELGVISEWGALESSASMRQSQIDGFSGDWADDARTLDEAVTRESSLNNAIELFRGMQLDPDTVDRLMDSDEFDLLATSSFSPDASLATQYATEDNDGGDRDESKIPVVIVGELRGMYINPEAVSVSGKESLVSASKLRIIDREVFTHSKHGEILVIRVEQ